MTDEMSEWIRARLDDAGRAAQRDLDAKRQVLAEHHPVEQRGPWRKETGYDIEIVCATCVDVYDDEDYGGHMRQFREHVPWPCPTIRQLAITYADQPGYKEEAWWP